MKVIELLYENHLHLLSAVLFQVYAKILFVLNYNKIRILRWILFVFFILNN